MLTWLLALLVTAIALAALYFAGVTRGVNAPDAADEAPERVHLRRQLDEIDLDATMGRLGPAEATAAKAELAREAIRLKDAPSRTRPEALRPTLVGLGLALVAILGFGVYGALGRPHLPSSPLATRPDKSVQNMNLDDAVSQIEARLKQAPDDLRGWTVIAPVYMQLGRFADAEHAIRRQIDLDGITADRETDLGEAIMMKQGGDMANEPMSLFESAANRDPAHWRSRYYLATNATQKGDYAAAVPLWEALIALAKGDESWLINAKAALEFAKSGGKPQMGNDQIATMVEGLSERLFSGGGTIDEWTRLVRSRLVLGQTDEAQKAYLAARAAYPDASVRTELDVLAADSGLVAQ